MVRSCSSRTTSWWLFCAAIISLKLLLLVCDSTPKLYLGDSMSYIRTALTGWIPGDRSYFYGYLIRWVALPFSSLQPLVVVQTATGIATALLTAWICITIFGLPRRAGYVFGFLCAIDPLQLTWERYVMTEAFSVCFYVLSLQQSFLYLRDGRISTLLLIQVLSTITLGFRMVFFPVFAAMALLLPLLAFVCASTATERVQGAARFVFLRRTPFWLHISTSVISFLLLDQVYRHAYGFLSHRQPAHLYATGYFLLAAWAPAVHPEDAPDPRLAHLIEQGDEFELGDFWGRAGQLWQAGRLISRWRGIEPDSRKSSDIALRTAMSALRRDPVAVLALAVKQYLVFWQDGQLQAWLGSDLGLPAKLKDPQLKLLIDHFHWKGHADLSGERQTFATWYYQSAWPYYFVPLLSPLLAFVLLFVTSPSDKAKAWFLFLHVSFLFAVTMLLSTAPIVRYFQPLSLLMLLVIALIAKAAQPDSRAVT